MEVEIELISKEFIKPSSPTPDHLRHYQLSFLDQLSPKVYNPWLLFYLLNNDDHVHHSEFNNITNISYHLKKSLSQVLSLYYPLAGRVKDGLNIIDCNDEGVPFFEARVKGKLSDVIDNPNINELDRFLPFKLDDVTELALGLQINVFECGGIAIGVCNSHQLSDALSNITFIKTWVATARREPDIVRPEFISGKLFPPKNLVGLNPSIGITRKNIMTKRFVFKAATIEALRAKYDENSLGEDRRRPSRVEALSAFIWSRFVAATNGDQSGHDDQKTYIVLHAVNLRPRFEPPLGENHFGNYFRVAITVPSLKTGEDLCHGFVRQVREEIRKIDKEFVRKLQEGNEHLELLKDRSEGFVKGEVITFAFTSLCRFPVYEADFGWGKPTWVGSAALNFHNVTVFMDAKNGDGIEAYLSLKDEDLAKLEVDKEFQACVSLTE
ncbi:Vinorine synthase [Morus notabilis]|uniref:Vinorine synthase n=1 Tax=Morus notabilis TaxID=981085 RepID=W9RC97_9ROSA|nr:vinorine synthase [Morus notabilis]EXB82427.1 Vinorine synthase [Morus notabilis]